MNIITSHFNILQDQILLLSGLITIISNFSVPHIDLVFQEIFPFRWVYCPFNFSQGLFMIFYSRFFCTNINKCSGKISFLCCLIYILGIIIMLVSQKSLRMFLPSLCFDRYMIVVVNGWMNEWMKEGRKEVTKYGLCVADQGS